MLRRALALGNCWCSLHLDHEFLTGGKASQDKMSVFKLKDLFKAHFAGHKGISTWESQ